MSDSEVIPSKSTVIDCTDDRWLLLHREYESPSRAVARLSQRRKISPNSLDPARATHLPALPPQQGAVRQACFRREIYSRLAGSQRISLLISEVSSYGRAHQRLYQQRRRIEHASICGVVACLVPWTFTFVRDDRCVATVPWVISQPQFAVSHLHTFLSLQRDAGTRLPISHRPIRRSRQSLCLYIWTLVLRPDSPTRQPPARQSWRRPRRRRPPLRRVSRPAPPEGVRTTRTTESYGNAIACRCRALRVGTASKNPLTPCALLNHELHLTDGSSDHD